MSGWPLFGVDAFTDRAFAGNPAAVCLLDEAGDDVWLQQVAAEMNLSETAFVRRLEDKFELRWLTPKVEVDLCGHATLAAAHVLWTTRQVSAGDPIRFATRSGTLTARPRDGLIELDFPATTATPAEAPAGLCEALGARPTYIGRSRFDYLAALDSPGELRSLAPDFAALLKVAARGVIVTSPSDDPRFDFLSRFFAPSAGIDEDPVTGSAHCCLAPYWAARLGKNRLTGYQASPRGGTVGMTIAGDRVLLAGQAVTVWQGELRR